MRRLFLRIFLWFWATVILTGISLVLAFFLQPQGVPSRWHAGLTDTAQYFGAATIEAFEQGGAAEGSKYLHRLLNDAHISACIFDASGYSLAGEHCSEFSNMTGPVVRGEMSHIVIRKGLVRIAVLVSRPGGHNYIYASELLAGPRAALGIEPGIVLLRAIVAFIVSGLICYFLTRYLTTPILRLRTAAQQIAAGQFSVRAEPHMELRQDELGDLVRDFNRMADKTENLISSQRQLLYDVSHELRSPLARLNVALDLLRGRISEDPALDRIETDLNRLNEMIRRLLTVAKLETTATLQSAPVEVAALVASVANDATFEAQEKDSRVDLVEVAQFTVLGDVNLLRSAIENVVRNAVRFTRSGTAVEVFLRIHPQLSVNEAMLVIRDHGAGVPEEELSSIFKPFYRATNASDQSSGGSGLGLAITERIVRLHGGRVRATNEPDGGLRIEITLPRYFPRLD